MPIFQGLSLGNFIGKYKSFVYSGCEINKLEQLSKATLKRELITVISLWIYVWVKHWKIV